MPRYFFHVEDGRSARDDEGFELADLRAARERAVVFAGDLLRHEAAQTCSGNDWQMKVCDEAGETLLTLGFFIHQHGLGA